VPRYRLLPLLALLLQSGLAAAASTTVPGGHVFSLGGPNRVANGVTQHRFSAREITDTKSRAELGMVIAQYNLGVMYTINGRYEAAAHWFRKAALSGHRESAFNFGVLLLNGQGQPRDELKAADWIQRSAARGLPEAQYLLGRLHFDGRGVARDPVAEAAWYRRAAEGGYPLAQHELGVLLHLGEGVARDPVEANAWFATADANGLDSRDALAVIDKELDPSARAAAEALADRYAAAHASR
jgi:TPR repeat protein